MLKKIALGVLILLVVGSVALFFWARAVFDNEYVRSAIAAQMSQALGQPVTIGTIGASIYPRVTVDLGTVAIGEPARIQVRSLHLGTSLGALFSRRIEHASVRLDGARVELPLPPLGATTTTAPPAAGAETDAGGAPVTLVSIDEIELSDVEIVSQQHTLRADIRVVPQGDGARIERATLRADDTAVEVTGEIEHLAGPVGTLALTAGTLDLDRLLLFLGAFAGNAASVATASSPASPAAAGSPTPSARLEVTLTADRARSGELVLQSLTGKAVATSEGVTVDPIAFTVFDGKYDGTLAVSMADATPTFRTTAALTNIDVAALVAYGGSPGTISGRLSGRADLAGSGANLAAATRTAKGSARIDIVDGVVPHLDLVRNVVLATSGRAGSTAQAAESNTGGEKFSAIGATLTIAGGQARTDNLTFESPDVTMAATGSVALDGSAVNLAGLVQLSEALSSQAGRDLVRYSAENGRVTLPVTVTGPASNLAVRVDLANAAQRALRNKVNEELDRAIKRNLGGLFKRPPK